MSQPYVLKSRANTASANTASVNTASVNTASVVSVHVSKPYVPLFVVLEPPRKIEQQPIANATSTNVANKSISIVAAAPYAPRFKVSVVDPVGPVVGTGPTKPSNVLNYSRLVGDESAMIDKNNNIASDGSTSMDTMDDFDRYLLTNPCGDVKLFRLSKKTEVKVCVVKKNYIRKSATGARSATTSATMYVDDTHFDHPCDWKWDEYVDYF